MYSESLQKLDQCPVCGADKVDVSRNMAPDSVVTCAICKSELCLLQELETSIANTAHRKAAEAIKLP